jgi:mannose-1-phosphate guanylyltransferase
VLPADHLISRKKAFHEALATAWNAARNERLVTFGIIPNSPETGYGYIRKGEPEEGGVPEVLRIDAFVEKPDEATALTYLQSGNYCWNSGMFMFRAAIVLEEMERHVPEMVAACRNAVTSGEDDLDFFRPDREAFAKSASDSIDYALMEKTDLAYILPANFGWDDLGDWNAVERLLKGDESNVELAKHVCHETNGSILYSSDEDEVIVTIGLEDVVVVRDGKATLIVHKDRTQEIKQIVNKLKSDSKLQKFL